jgi:surface polysaccharide O-acyltransferase-like enzyme
MGARISGFDYLRAILSVFVVVLHCGILGTLIDGTVSVEEILRFNLFFLAVPMFIFMSIYLFIDGPVNAHVLRKKSSEVASIFYFGVSCLFCFIEGGKVY